MKYKTARRARQRAKLYLQSCPLAESVNNLTFYISIAFLSFILGYFIFRVID